MNTIERKSIGGKGGFIGWGDPIPVPIPFNPARYEGAMLYAVDGNIYYSDGAEWRLYTSVPVNRPYALVPRTSAERRMLRLSGFSTGFGYGYLTQTAVIFEASLNQDMSDPILFEVIESTNANSLTIDLDTVFDEGQTFYWRGKYIATENQESAFSLPYRQVYPYAIDPIKPLIAENAMVARLRIESYASAFDFPYARTEWEIYQEDNSQAGNRILQVNTFSPFLDLISYRDQLIEPAYYWRARHVELGGRTSPWMDSRRFVMAPLFQLKDLTDNVVFVSREVLDSRSNAYILPNTVRDSNNNEIELI